MYDIIMIRIRRPRLFTSVTFVCVRVCDSFFQLPLLVNINQLLSFSSLQFHALQNRAVSKYAFTPCGKQILIAITAFASVCLRCEPKRKPHQREHRQRADNRPMNFVSRVRSQRLGFLLFRRRRWIPTLLSLIHIQMCIRDRCKKYFVKLSYKIIT